MKNISKITLLSVLILALIYPAGPVLFKKGEDFLNLSSFKVLAQNKVSASQENLDKICQWEKIEEKPKDLSNQEYKDLLKKCQKYYQEKSKEIEKDINQTQKKKKTLQNKIYTLGKKIKNLNYQIYQSNLAIKDLGVQAKDTEASISQTSLKIKNSRGQLSSILRIVYEKDQISLAELLLSEKDLSGFFNDLTNLETLNSKNQELLQEIKNLRAYLENQKESLEEDKRNLEKMVAIQSIQRQESSRTKKEKEYFLKMTEAEYQKHLKEKKETEKRMAEIRARIWKLIGVRKAPKYEDAVKIAKDVSKITGIRPAFLLGILTQESRIGKDVGQCYLKDTKTGMGIKFKTGRKWPRVMKPAWIPLFLETIKELNKEKKLNINPYATPVSCWIAACVNKNYHVTYRVSVDSKGKISCPSGYVPFGWGGAMGPAQLMPFNWIGSDKYKDKIEEITGEVADPWDFHDSALGAALHLKDCRADLSERKAAACYFGGWGNRNNPYHLQAYADPVLSLSKCHQQFIDKGSMSAKCEEWIF